MFRKILVPLDGSALAEQALSMAATVAAGAASIELVLVDTYALRQSNVRAPGNASERVYVSGVAKEATRLLGVPVNGVVVDGDPATAIVQHAADIDADLIVMTTHGRTGMLRAVMGSVADAVVRNAGRPVLVQRPMTDRRWRTVLASRFHHVLVPLDGDVDETLVIRPVLDLCRIMEARPILARVVYPVVDVNLSEAGVAMYGVTDEEATQRIADRAQDALSALALDIESDTRMPVETSVEIGNDVGETLLRVARRRNADLVALTSHARGVSRLFAGSVADKLLRGSDLPLLLFHPKHAAEIDSHRPFETVAQA